MSIKSNEWKMRLATLKHQLQIDRSRLPEFRLLIVEWPEDDDQLHEYPPGRGFEIDPRKIVAQAWWQRRFPGWVSGYKLGIISREVDQNTVCYSFERFRPIAVEIAEILSSLTSNVPKETTRIRDPLPRLFFALDDLLTPQRYAWNGTPVGAARADRVRQYAWLLDVVLKTIQAVDILTAGATPPPLTEREGQVLTIIRNQPTGRGITGKKILDRLRAEGASMEQGTLTGHIIPILKKWHGVRNRGRVGYYVEKVT